MIAIIIPYRGTVNDKSRLRTRLKDSYVNDLLHCMTQNIISEIEGIETKTTLYILTKRKELDFSGSYTILEDKGDELNNSLRRAFNEITEDIIVIIMADLPLIKSENIQFILNKYSVEKKILLAPTPDKGTSILIFNQKNNFPLVFGKESALRFQEVFQKLELPFVILETKNAYRDIDKFKDLVELEKNSYLQNNIKEIIKECVEFE
jgi:2-phospho-L-lactate guanylyltransferase